METRALGELRALPGREIGGVVLRYGDHASLPDGRRERFVAGAFGSPSDAPLNLQHDSGSPLGQASLTHHDDRIEARAEVPEAIHALVKRGTLKGMSVEFRSVTESDDSGVRVVEQADLIAVAIVDAPAYGQSRVEARRKATGGHRRAIWEALG